MIEIGSIVHFYDLPPLGAPALGTDVVLCPHAALVTGVYPAGQNADIVYFRRGDSHPSAALMVPYSREPKSNHWTHPRTEGE